MAQAGQAIIGVIGSLQGEIRRHEKRAAELRQALAIVANGKNPLALAKAGFKRHVAASAKPTHWTQRMTETQRTQWRLAIAKGQRRRLQRQKA